MRNAHYRTDRHNNTQYIQQQNQTNRNQPNSQCIEIDSIPNDVK